MWSGGTHVGGGLVRNQCTWFGRWFRRYVVMSDMWIPGELPLSIVRTLSEITQPSTSINVTCPPNSHRAHVSQQCVIDVIAELCHNRLCSPNRTPRHMAHGHASWTRMLIACAISHAPDTNPTTQHKSWIMSNATWITKHSLRVLMLNVLMYEWTSKQPNDHTLAT